MTATVTVALELESPYKGLAPFEDTDVDALLFFGRERESQIVAMNMLASRLTVLYGQTGVGKSSLLRAGVARAVRELTVDGEVLIFSSWRDDPVAALCELVAPGDAHRSLVDAAAARGADLYLILDQFEEYFLYHGAARGAGSLVDELSELVNGDTSVNVLIGIREDALAMLDVFKPRLPSLFGNYIRLDHLDRASACDAILGPLDRYAQLTGEAWGAEPKLVEAVLDEVAAGKIELGRGDRSTGTVGRRRRVEAAFLQLVLERLWEVERQRGSTTLSLETLRALGGAQRIVEDHLQRAMSSLTRAQQDVAAVMFDHLVTPSGSKIAHRLSDLAMYAGVPENELRPVADRLAAQRILRSAGADDAGDDRFEIFHDVLGYAVLAWRAAHEAERRVEAERLRHRRTLRLLALAVAALAVMTGIAVYAVVQRHDARVQARNAQARELAARAVVALGTDPQESLRLSVRAAQLEPTAQTEGVLRQALLAARLRRVIRLGGPGTALAYTPAGDLVAARADGAVTLRARDGTVRATLRLPSAPAAVAAAPDGSVLAAGGNVVLVRLASGRTITLRHPAPVRSAAFARNGAVVVSGAADGAIRIWRGGGALVRTIHGPPDVRSVAPSPDGTRIATVAAGADGHVQTRLYDSRSGRLLRTLSQIGVTTAVFDPRGRLLATGSADGSMLLSRARDGRPVRTLDNAGAVADAAFSPDGSMLAVASRDNAVRIWSVANGERTFFFVAHRSPLTAIAFAPSGRFVVSAGEDRTARMWLTAGFEQGTQAGLLAGHVEPITDVAVSPDSRTVATTSADGTVRLWDAAVEQHLAVVAHTRKPAVAFVDSKPVAVATRPGAARALERARRFAHVAVTVAAVSPGGDRIATGAPDGSVRLYTAQGRLLHVMRGHSGSVLDVRFDPSGDYLVSSSDGSRNNVIEWDARSGRRLHVLAAHSGAVSAVSFSFDGRWILTAGPVAAAVWSAGSEAPLFYLRGPTDLLTDAEWSPNGYRVATVSRDRTLRTYPCTVCTPTPQLLALARSRLAGA